ncbi:MAG: hypothetical protein R3D98_05385 [Candidatus Krumholzibacteriia bacterium]
MKDQCLDADRIAAALRSGPDHPDRRHLDGCPWCQALAASHDLFLDDRAALPAEADPEAAAASLEAFLDEHVAGGARSRRRGPGRLAATSLVLAVAAVVILAVGIHGQREDPMPGSRPVNLRGPDAGAAVVLDAPRMDADGSVVLAWSTELDGVGEVQVVNSRREVLARFAAAAGRTFRIAADTLGSLVASGEDLFVMVVILDEGDEVARSAPRLLPAPAAR